VRFAVHTGEAVERDWDYVGSTVNRAARLRAVVQGGEVLVSEATARLAVDRLPDSVRLVELGPVALRDLDRPEPAYALAGPGLPAPRLSVGTPGSERSGTALPPELEAAVSSGPFTGRRPELDILRRLWRRAAGGHSTLALITGEPGTGKSRLVAELANEVLHGGGIVALGSCSAQGSRLGPIAQAARSLAARDSGPAGSAIEALVRAAETQMVLLVVEDLQWADAVTFDILRGVIDDAGAAALLVVATMRGTPPEIPPELATFVSDIVEKSGAHHLELDAFDRQRIGRSGAAGIPIAATSLIDRADELARIGHLISRHRLVTLVGGGGTGKTRLATHFASTTPDREFGGVWCAEFAALHGRDNVAEVILDAIGGRAGPDADASERVIRHLSVRSGLLVLDNCEHVKATVAAVCTALLRFAPGVRTLVTSREPLGVAGEALLKVRPLATPAADDHATIAAADAVRLFVDRATSYDAAFSLDDENAPAVAQLCRSLDGLPLAIELAAARVPTMTPQEIVSRLDHRFQILGDRPGLSDHHRTLRATLDWSYELLEPDEQALLSQLAIFAPGFTLDAVERFAGPAPAERHVLDVLSALIVKSMVLAEARAGATRLRLLETVRAYALEKAAAWGIEDEARDRHLAIYTQRAEELADVTVISDVDSRNDRLAADAANLRIALDHAVTTGDREAVFRLTAVLVDLWCLRGWGGTILRALEAVLGDDMSESPEHGAALANAGWAAWSQGRHARAVAWCEQSRQCSASLGAPTDSRALLVLGLVRMLDDGDAEAGAELCERALRQLRETGQMRRYAHDLASYATYVAVTGDERRSSDVAAEAVALARRMGDHHSLSIGLNAQAYASIATDPVHARSLFAEVIEIADPWCAASAHWGRGWLDDIAGADAAALAGYRRALELWHETGDWRGIHYAVVGIGILATRAGHHVPAVCLFAGALAAGSDVGSASMPAWNVWRDRHLDRLRAAVSPRQFSTEWAAGERLSQDVLVKEALMEARRLEPPPG
jgi:predicted ATPase